MKKKWRNSFFNGWWLRLDIFYLEKRQNVRSANEFKVHKMTSEASGKYAIYELRRRGPELEMRYEEPQTALDKEPSGIKVKSDSSGRFNNVMKRIFAGHVMVFGYILVVYSGPLVILFAAYVIQVLCLQEILAIAYNSNKIPRSLPYFRSLCWYFIIAANYFLSLEVLPPHFHDVVKKFHYIQILIKYHRFIAFCIYFAGIVIFVFSLVRKYDLKQFKILAWTHTLVIILVVQVYLIIENMFDGLIWLILPLSLVILNDIFAYVFGRLWGRTPLIELSPKKTWEGFIGGAIGTFLSGLILTHVLCQYKYLVCPVEYSSYGTSIKMKSDCNPGYLFTPVNYSIGSLMSVSFYPFMYHFIPLVFFASIIAPFGGFCASGFKRAFKIKDFGDSIPGHGGIMDRFDCQFLMGMFVHVYIFTFIKNPSVDLIFQKVLSMDENSQIQFYYILRDSLQTSNFFNTTVT